MARLFVLEAVENGSKVAAVFQFHGSLSFLCIIALTLSLISMAIFACAETGKKRKRHGSYAGAGTAGAFNGGVIVTDGGGHHHHGGGGGGCGGGGGGHHVGGGGGGCGGGGGFGGGGGGCGGGGVVSGGGGF